MTYELRYRQMEIPELDKFLEEYRALCERHGVQFSSENYDYDGGAYVTIERFSNGGFHLNLDESDFTIPFMAKARQEAERLRDIESAADAARKKKAAEDRREAEENAALKNGVMLNGKRYKLIPE